MLVEDSDDSREILRDLLQLDGHQVETAANGREGLELILTSVPQVAFVDIGLPELDGYELARQVRQSAAAKHAYLVALTGYGRERDRQAVFDAGFDEYLVKPVGPQELNQALSDQRIALRSGA